MDGEGEIERAMRKLSVEHAETRWLALRLDDDVKEIRQELRTMHEEQTARFDSIDGRLGSIDGALEQHGVRLQEHGGRIDSVDAQLRTLTQMVGQVLERLSEGPDT